MVKILRNNNTVVVILNNGVSLQKNGIDDKFMDRLREAADSENTSEILSLFDPNISKVMEAREQMKQTIRQLDNTKILTKKGDSVYWEEISQLSMPQHLVQAVLQAEEDDDKIKLETYRNFWTLMSLNPDERCRQNLFWFLENNGLTLSRSGFFVAYRNVKQTDKADVFTDHYTGTFEIKIGEMVTMPREDCDSVQENTCSRGLHLAHAAWLKQNDFGNVGLVCLCNPADVVAVPPVQQYGKLRTCAYMPIGYAEYDKDGNIVPFNAETGFECPYVISAIYEGLLGTESEAAYTINIPDIPSLNKQVISDRLFDIAKECIVNRNTYVESHSK